MSCAEERCRWATPWHRESFERFIEEGLPALLAERLPLIGYSIETGDGLSVTVTLGRGHSEAEARFDGLPAPDERGVFMVDDRPRVVVPVAAGPSLADDVRCVGEQLLSHIERRVGEAPKDLQWDEDLVRSWVPLTEWLRGFLLGEPTSQALDRHNWLAEHTHLRRILFSGGGGQVQRDHIGLVCYIETPEGPNVGRVLTVATGAEIKDGRLVRVDDRPNAALSPSAAAIPFLNHDEVVRALMGANMMRQWCPPPDPEPALVRTGLEPDLPDFWCGRSLLTAYVSLGVENYEDAIVLSEAAAARLGHPAPIEVGDKLSNRHGQKGVVGEVRPDSRMPRLPDGTSVELAFSFSGLHTRLNVGQLWECAAGRVAKLTGRPFVAPPLDGPGEEELRAALRALGLRDDGLEQLSDGDTGLQFDLPSTVGWVYWGRVSQHARDKLGVFTGRDCGEFTGRPTRWSWKELEYRVLRDRGALLNIHELFSVLSADRPDAATLCERIAAGGSASFEPPSPAYCKLARGLAAGGISAELEGERLRLWFAGPPGEPLRLAVPVRHPWARERRVAEVGRVSGCVQLRLLEAVNRKVERILGSGAPASLADAATAELEGAVRDYLDALVTPELLQPSVRSLFSGKAVLAPGPELQWGEIGLPDPMAWALFGPLAAREVGWAEVDARTDRAAVALDAAMAARWVLVDRPPCLMSSSVVAVRPTRHSGLTIKLNPIMLYPLNGDHDGDQVGVRLALSDEAQREAGERLTLAAQVLAEPGLLGDLCLRSEVMWGLAWLGLSPDGRRQIEEVLGYPLRLPDGIVSRAALSEALGEALRCEGPEAALTVLERLVRLGLRVCSRSGASMSPFAGSSVDPPSPAANGEDPDTWVEWTEEYRERVMSSTDYRNPDLGVQLLLVKSGGRGNQGQLGALIGFRAQVAGWDVEPTVIRNGLRHGLTPAEHSLVSVGARAGLLRMHESLRDDLSRATFSIRPRGYSVLARAMRADRPGVVFAQAAATGEVDPLPEPDCRLFVGLPAR